MIRCVDITHYYGDDLALENINFEASTGEFIAIVGESGSGKSTLLSILSSLLKPTSGDLFYEGKNFNTIKDIDHFREENIGFIFQFHYLISYLKISENIEIASKNRELDNYKKDLFKKLGIENILNKYADEISGGQRQRAAIARAFINKPKILFADEPTGNLDSKNSKNVYELFRDFAKNGTTIITATHDKELANQADRIIEMRDGRVL